LGTDGCHITCREPCTTRGRQFRNPGNRGHGDSPDREGAIRYITNKPKLDVTEGGVSASYSSTAHGDPSAAAQAFINLPLIPDRLAFRAVIYDDRRGGYINNVPGTFTRQPTDGGIVSYFGGVVPTNSQTLSNANVAGNAINPVTYTGVRGSLYYKFNDDWNDQDLFSREQVTVIKRDLI
jgi:hypothetical protein